VVPGAPPAAELRARNRELADALEEDEAGAAAVLLAVLDWEAGGGGLLCPVSPAAAVPLCWWEAAVKAVEGFCRGTTVVMPDDAVTTTGDDSGGTAEGEEVRPELTSCRSAGGRAVLPPDDMRVRGDWLAGVGGSASGLAGWSE